jgi:hypothetical protein
MDGTGKGWTTFLGRGIIVGVGVHKKRFYQENDDMINKVEAVEAFFYNY